MWVFLDSGTYLFIVFHRQHSGKLLVRARLEGDIEHTLACAEMHVMPEAN